MTKTTGLNFKAMRARKDGDITFPCIAQVKIDGVRALVKDGVVYSRALKPIPNKHVQQLFGHLHGFDGELLLNADPTVRCFNDTTSAVMTIEGTPDVCYHVYDDWRRGSALDSGASGVEGMYYSEWYSLLVLNFKMEAADQFDNFFSRCILHPYTTIECKDDLENYYNEVCEKGLEGLIIRNPNAPYRQGTATKKNWELVKWKPKDDAEFKVVGFEELIRKDGSAAGMLGALILEYGDTTFKVGTGFIEAERRLIWRDHSKYLGRWVKVEYEGIAKNKPRFPSFKGFRAESDMI